MTIHYHGTPITPRSVLHTLAGKHFCVSYAASNDVGECHKIGQSVLLDNGAFSFWRIGKETDWTGYYAFVDTWLSYPTTWAIIPDVIDGGVEVNDRLLADWPFSERGSPVWHLHEPLDRLLHLIDAWPRVCVGSSAEYAEIGTAQWHERITRTFNEVSRRNARLPWLHMLRGMSLAGSHYPFASLDSTDVARNHNRTKAKATSLLGEPKMPPDARKMADRWDAQQCAGRWVMRANQVVLELTP